MAYNSVSGAAIQYVTSGGEVASGYYLKFYIANTTTPLSMATDSTGGTTLVKCKLNDKGYPISNPLDNTTVFIPHVNASYRFVLYVNETDADNNTTANADVNIPDIAAMLGSDAIGTASDELATNAHIATQVHGGQYMTYGGTADAITLTSVNTVALTALANGQEFFFYADDPNTTAVTFNVDGIGALSGVDIEGNALTADYMVADKKTKITYDLANTRFIIDEPQSQIGVNQTWQDVTASRAYSTVYTNTTSKPIMVSIRYGTTANALCELFVDAMLIGETQFNLASSVTMTAIIPTGSTYEARLTAGILRGWNELR